MSYTQPTILILRGNDEHAVKAYLQSLIDQLGDPAITELNLTRLDGLQASIEELSNATGAIPFLAARRLVIFTHPLERVRDSQAQERFKMMLDSLPETTLLVLVVDDQPKYQKGVPLQWSLLNPKHWLIQWAKQAGERVQVLDFALPPSFEMPAWIQKQARQMGGQFTRSAAEALASHIGSDTRLASLEIEKLLTYVDFKRPVEAEDVELLTAARGQASIFDMTDALAQGNLPTAQR
ncbi:MAG: DNA polymerase III subunit delta, partial [Anaerolineales bacterium]